MYCRVKTIYVQAAKTTLCVGQHIQDYVSVFVSVSELWPSAVWQTPHGCRRWEHWLWGSLSPLRRWMAPLWRSAQQLLSTKCVDTLSHPTPEKTWKYVLNSIFFTWYKQGNMTLLPAYNLCVRLFVPELEYKFYKVLSLIYSTVGHKWCNWSTSHSYLWTCLSGLLYKNAIQMQVSAVPLFRMNFLLYIMQNTEFPFPIF